MTKTQKVTLIWAFIAFLFMVFAVNITSSNEVQRAGFWLTSWIVVVGSVFGFGGAMIGDGLRRFAMPSGYVTSGGMSSHLRIKIFWMIGPQSIGLFIGCMLGQSLVLM